MEIDSRLERVLWTKAEIIDKTKVLGKEISEYYKDKDTPIVVGVLKGCLIFYAYLITKFECDIDTDYIKISATRGSTTKDKITIEHDMVLEVKGRNIIVVEDIIDTATTLKTLKKHLMNKGAKEVKIVTLIDKPSGRRTEFNSDWVGFVTDTNQWIAGFGIDINENMRYLPYMGVLKKEFEE